MPELQPHITYSPEGILSVRRPQPEAFEDVHHAWFKNQADLDELEAERQQRIEELAESSYATVETVDDNEIVRIDISKCFRYDPISVGKRAYGLAVSKMIMGKLRPLASANRTDTPASVDQVLPFHNIVTPIPVVTEHFQRWLNQFTLDEATAKDCLSALALPFVDQDKVEDEFDPYCYNDVAIASTRLCDVELRRDDFTVEKSHKKNLRHPREQTGTVFWNHIDLSHRIITCPSVGVDGGERFARQDPNNANLYKMQYHDIHEGVPQYALSMVLGLGTLAHYAAAYEGTEDIFADVRWDKPRRASKVEFSSRSL